MIELQIPDAKQRKTDTLEIIINCVAVPNNSRNYYII